MLSNAYFLAKFRFDTAENEPAKNLQIFEKCIFEKCIFEKCIFEKCIFRSQRLRRTSVSLTPRRYLSGTSAASSSGTSVPRYLIKLRYLSGTSPVPRHLRLTSGSGQPSRSAVAADLGQLDAAEVPLRAESKESSRCTSIKYHRNVKSFRTIAISVFFRATRLRYNREERKDQSVRTMFSFLEKRFKIKYCRNIIL